VAIGGELRDPPLAGGEQIGTGIGESRGAATGRPQLGLGAPATARAPRRSDRPVLRQLDDPAVRRPRIVRMNRTCANASVAALKRPA
jgi:hypothetical protein